MPHFIIIGGQRCGTTSLYEYLKKHPCIFSALVREVHFFDDNFAKGVSWYRAHFPTLLYRNYIKSIRKQDFVTGEASPYYLFHPHAPKRVHETIPRVKLIVLLRDPIDRAYSHYHHEVRLGFENLSFKEAIKKERERLRGQLEKIANNDNYVSFNHNHYSYVSRGIYVDQLKIWMRFFPRKQILILKSEDLFDNPSRNFDSVTDFLQLPKWQLKEYRKYHVGHYTKMGATIRKQLLDFFEPHNQRLFDYLKMDFGWGK